MAQGILEVLKNLNALYGEEEAFALLKWLLEKQLTKKIRNFTEVREVFQRLPSQHHLWNDVDALQKGQPIQHILKKAYFLNLELEVNEHTLIPRPETEELVDYAKQLFSKNTNLVIVDVGTGSGCIPIALAQHFVNGTVKAIDVSKKALLVAKRNADKYNLDIEFIHLDILAEIPEFKIDILISNPPYIVPSEKAMMHKNVLDFEPNEALFVPQQNPLLFYKRLQEIAEFRLKPKGLVLLEINPLYAAETLALFTKAYEAVLINDMQGKQRFLKAIKK